ncbi:ABC transporter substrate-binding protein [Nocardioides mangrovicus]|uniref:ABC transporter substrate-binding protein n=1 Tax=Nocardioides mangrovicus TaxID=2478913 RepID=A0A3L8P021_9ACTN|nr:ABC transporter substrate-binding protein [Nocardioides mangrovicus]RLV48524.1 ABC transporter substrate-binding protein [Nocardioides mangrovicus]
MRHLSGLLVVLLLACGTAACGVGTGDDGVERITYWSASQQSTLDWIDSHFNATHRDVQVHGEYIASADDLTAKEISALKTNTYPNVVIGQDPSNLPLLAESRKVVDLRRALKDVTDRLYPGIRQSVFSGGRQLGFPISGVGNFVLFYNKADFAAAGITRAPQTWPELIADAKKLTVGKRYGIYIPLGASEWSSYVWETLLWSNGGELLSKDGRHAAFDSPAGVQALTWWTDLVRQEKAAPSTSYAQAGSYDGAPAFAGHDVSMIIEGQFALSVFKDAKIDFGVAPLPAGTTGKAIGAVGVGVASVFDKGARANRAAETFLDWLGQPRQGAYLASSNGGLPSSPDQIDQPLVRKQIAQDPTYTTFSDQLKSSRSRPTVLAYAAVSQALYTQIDAALRGRLSPQAALHKAAQQADAALKETQ